MNVIDWMFDNLGWVITGVVILLLVALFFATKEKMIEEQRLMKQCMDDGKKEYECRALIKQSDTTYIPIIIPMTSGR